MSDIHGNVHECCERVIELGSKLAAATKERDEAVSQRDFFCTENIKHMDERDNAVAAASANHIAKVDAMRQRDEARVALREAIDWLGKDEPTEAKYRRWIKAAGLEDAQ